MRSDLILFWCADLSMYCRVQLAERRSLKTQTFGRQSLPLGTQTPGSDTEERCFKHRQRLQKCNAEKTKKREVGFNSFVCLFFIKFANSNPALTLTTKRQQVGLILLHAGMLPQMQSPGLRVLECVAIQCVKNKDMI